MLLTIKPWNDENTTPHIRNEYKSLFYAVYLFDRFSEAWKLLYEK
jgi:hypothetical protein